LASAHHLVGSLFLVVSLKQTVLISVASGLNFKRNLKGLRLIYFLIVWRLLNQAVEYPLRRFQILLQSSIGPIDLYLVRSGLLSCPLSFLTFSAICFLV
jgi:hypothetical protein